MEYCEYVLKRHCQYTELQKSEQLVGIVDVQSKDEFIKSVLLEINQTVPFYYFLKGNMKKMFSNIDNPNINAFYLDVVKTFIAKEKKTKNLSNECYIVYNTMQKQIQSLDAEDRKFNDKLYDLLIDYLHYMSSSIHQKAVSWSNIDFDRIVIRILNKTNYWKIEKDTVGRFSLLMKMPFYNKNIVGGVEAISSLVVGHNGFRLYYETSTFLGLLLCTYTRLQEELEECEW